MADVTTEPSVDEPGDDRRLKKDFGTIGLLFTAVGSIIGSGWLFGALNASQMAGPASIISWILGGIMFIFIGMSYSELGTMFPHSGGVARYPHYSFGSFTSFSMGWLTWVAAAAVAPIEVLAVVQYSNNWLPWLQDIKDGQPTLTGPGIVVSVALMALFVLVNFFGVRWFQRLNNLLVWWKLLMIVLVIAVFVVIAFNTDHFHAAEFGGFAPYGTKGIFAAVAGAGIAFSYFGFRQGVELAGETDNPKKNVPLTLIGSVVITGILYVGLQVAFIGSVPSEAITAEGWSKVGLNFTGETEVLATFGPLAAIAGILGAVWLAGLLYADAIISPGDTGMIYAGVTARLSYAMGRNRNAPAGLAKVDKNGVPWVSLLLAFIVGCLFFLPFPGWAQLVPFLTSATVLSFGSGPIVLLAMRKQLPEQHRPYKLGDKMVWIIGFLALWSTNLIVYWTGWDQNWKLFLLLILGWVLMVAFLKFSKQEHPKLDLGAGTWVFVWFAGLALISFLGNYPAEADGAGNLGLFGLAGGFVATLVLTVIVIWVSLKNALPRERVEEILAESKIAHGDAPSAH